MNARHYRPIARACAVLAATIALAAPAVAQPRYGGGITVFADINFSGTSQTFQQDVPNLQVLGFNDAISSIQVAEGEVWQICRDANYQSRCQNVTGSLADLRSLNWNDEISSLRRVSGGGFRGRGPGGFARGGPIVVFSEPNFRGRSLTLREDTPNIVPFGLNDQITSIQIPPGESWEVCVDVDYGNRCTVLTESVADLRRIGWNDRISSLRRVGGRFTGDRGYGRGYPDYRQRAQAELIFYDRPNFRGGTTVVTREFANRAGLPWGGSLQVRGGGEWELCDKWGQCVTIDRDVPYLDDLGLDRITTVREVNTRWPFIR